jgi:outer membrane lipoprotein-sorting protein
MNKFSYIVLAMFVFFSDVYASEKERAIENLKKINSIKFNFTQISNDGTESGSCIVVYPKKMRCLYKEEDKEIVVNGDNFFLTNKKENKDYNYNIKDTPLGIILDKENILEQLSKIEKFNKINNNIIATINLSSQESIDIYFDSEKMNISGWKIINYDKSYLEFLIKDILINVNTKDMFDIPIIKN